MWTERLTRGHRADDHARPVDQGRFHALPEKRVVHAGGHLFRVSYRHDERDADREARGAGKAVNDR